MLISSLPSHSEDWGACLDLNVCLGYYRAGRELCICYTEVPVLRITDFQPGDLLNYILVCITVRAKSVFFFLYPFVWRHTISRALKQNCCECVGWEWPAWRLCSEYEVPSWSLNSGLFFSLKYKQHPPQDVFLTPSSPSWFFLCYHFPQPPTFTPGYCCLLTYL